MVFGCIISIQVGQCGTAYFHRLSQLPYVPALPMPVITFSMYTLIVNVVMKYTTNDC
jgi:hypothetical protein